MHRHVKGQLSLEFAVKFVIVGVVIAVVLGLVFNTLPDDTPDVGERTRSIENIRNTCRQECQDWQTTTGVGSQQAALEYCTRRFVSDLNNNGYVKGEIVGSGYNAYCEDGIHCFNVHSCDKDGRILDIETCTEIMCRYYTSPEGEAMGEARANTTIKRLYEEETAEGNRGIGTCDLQNVEGAAGETVNTWYNDSIAFPDNVCSDLP